MLIAKKDFDCWPQAPKPKVAALSSLFEYWPSVSEGSGNALGVRYQRSAVREFFSGNITYS